MSMIKHFRDDFDYPKILPEDEEEYQVAESTENPYVMTETGFKLKGRLIIGFDIVPYETDVIPIFGYNLETRYVLIDGQKCILKSIRLQDIYELDKITTIETGIQHLGIYLTVKGYKR